MIGKLKSIIAFVAVVLVFAFLSTNGIVWNKPRPQVYGPQHPYCAQWALEYGKRGITIVGVYEKPAFIHWLFGSVRVHPIRTNPAAEYQWEWLDGNAWRPIPPNADYHL